MVKEGTESIRLNSGVTILSSEIIIVEKGKVKEVKVDINNEAKYWMTKAQQSVAGCKIAERLDLSRESERFLCSTFLGIRLLGQHQLREKELIRQAELRGLTELLGREYVGELWFKVHEAEHGIANLKKATEIISQQYGISLNRKNRLELAINALTTRFFFEKAKSDRASEVKFNPDKRMLEEWQREWRPQLAQV